MSKIGEDPKIRFLARELGVKSKSNPEERIRELCVHKIERARRDFVEKQKGTIDSLDKLLEVTAASLGVRFEEVHSDEDLQDIKKRYVAKRELAFLEFMDDFDDDTDAVLVWLRNANPWEPKLVAIVDCRGLKAYRAYFSKWHEIAHVLTTPSQMHLPFRRTRTNKREPEEILMDMIAADLGFYSPLFLPEVRARTDNDKRLTFDVVDELRREVCPSASPQATLRAAVERVSFPCLFLIADYALKKEEERLINSDQYSLFPKGKVEKKLRATQVQTNSYARESGLRIFKNMEVPDQSIVRYAYDKLVPGQLLTREENLDWWESSKDCLNCYDTYVEAKKVGDRVWAIMNPI